MEVRDADGVWEGHGMVSTQGGFSLPADIGSIMGVRIGCPKFGTVNMGTTPSTQRKGRLGKVKVLPLACDMMHLSMYPDSGSHRG